MTIWQWIVSRIRPTPRPAPPPQPPTPVVPPLPGWADEKAKLLVMLNAEHARLGLLSLRENVSLTSAAQAWANIMQARRAQEHAPPDEIARRMRLHGYNPLALGEILGEPWSNGVPMTAAQVFAMWMNDPPHRRQIQDASFLDVGIGYAGGYWCVDFGVE